MNGAFLNVYENCAISHVPNVPNGRCFRNSTTRHS